MSASFAAKRLASDRSGSSRPSRTSSSEAKSRSFSRGVRDSARSNRAMSTTSTPTPWTPKVTRR